MRISDWSSDVCASDLAIFFGITQPEDTGFGRLLMQFARQFALGLPAVAVGRDPARHETAHALRQRFVGFVIIGRTGTPIVEGRHGALLGRADATFKRAPPAPLFSYMQRSNFTPISSPVPLT